MSIDEAVGLVLRASAAGLAPGFPHRGCVFVLDMGEPLRIVDVARRVIRLAGLKPERDIEIVYTGLREGEKLFESLFHAEEVLVSTAEERVLAATSEPLPLPRLTRDVTALIRAAEGGDERQMRLLLRELVPGFSDASSPETTSGPAFMPPDWREVPHPARSGVPIAGAGLAASLDAGRASAAGPPSPFAGFCAHDLDRLHHAGTSRAGRRPVRRACRRARSAAVAAGPASPETSLGELLAPFVWRRGLLALCVLAGIAIAAVVALASERQYAATAKLLVGSGAGAEHAARRGAGRARGADRAPARHGPRGRRDSRARSRAGPDARGGRCRTGRRDGAGDRPAGRAGLVAARCRAPGRGPPGAPGGGTVRRMAGAACPPDHAPALRRAAVGDPAGQPAPCSQSPSAPPRPPPPPPSPPPWSSGPSPASWRAGGAPWPGCRASGGAAGPARGRCAGAAERRVADYRASTGLGGDRAAEQRLAVLDSGCSTTGRRWRPRRSASTA